MNIVEPTWLYSAGTSIALAIRAVGAEQTLQETFKFFHPNSFTGNEIAFAANSSFTSRCSPYSNRGRHSRERDA